MKISKQEYTAEFKELAVKRVKLDQTAGTVAKDFGLMEQTLRNLVKASDAGKLNSVGSKVVTPELMELSRLRAENIRLKRENEILKKSDGVTIAIDVQSSTLGLMDAVGSMALSKCSTTESGNTRHWATSHRCSIWITGLRLYSRKNW